MERDRDARLEQRDRPRGPRGIHVAASDPWPPPPDRQQREVEAARDCGSCRRTRPCRPRRTRAPFPSITYPSVCRAREKGWRRPSWATAMGCTTPHPPERVPRHGLGHVAEARAAQQARAPARRDRRTRAQQPERASVQVIEVRVRDQHGVGVVELVERRERRQPAEVHDALAQDGVREEAHATHLDLHRRVPDVGDSDHACYRGSSGRARLGNPVDSARIVAPSSSANAARK